MATKHEAVRIEQRRMQVGLANIAYEVAGDGDPVVLIHGLSGSTRWWDRAFPLLARHYRVYVVDLIGFGASRATHSFVLREAAAYMASWLDRLDLERASIVGHSMGGVIAADLAADYPHRVGGLVLVDAAVFVAEQNPVAHAFGVAQEFLLRQPHMLPILASDAWRAGLTTIARAAAELLTTDLREKLSQVAAPTLVVWGELDTITPLAAGRRLVRALPNARLAPIRGAGHNPMWERPAAFTELVGTFLAGGVFGEAPSRPEPSNGPDPSFVPSTL